MVHENKHVNRPDDKDDWQKINWSKCHRIVRKLQVRITKAIKRKEWRKVNNLRHLLKCSYSARAIAVKKVCSNKGKRTAGVDGELLKEAKSKLKMVHKLKLNPRSYKAKPLKRIYIPKSNGKMRPLGIPTIKDRAVQMLYLLGLDPISEIQADPNSYGFRSERCCQDAIQQVFLASVKKNSAQWVLEADIKGCFDNISHEWILNNIPIHKNILKQWLKCGFIETEDNKVISTEAGTPQGGIISPVISNMTLDGLETVIKRLKLTKTNFIRYADDFIVTGTNQKDLIKVKKEISNFLTERGLILSEEKTQITHINEGYDFLGFNIRKYNGKLLVKPSKKSIKNFRTKIKSTFKKHRTSRIDVLLSKLNPIIRGWGNYYSKVVSKEIFIGLDAYIWKKSYNWMKRRHQSRKIHKYYDKYFKKNGSDRLYSKKDDKEYYTFSLARIPIRRHVKIKANANPYDPEFEEYFEKREQNKWKQECRYQRKLSLYILQVGKCPLCNQSLKLNEELDIHRILPGSKGGDYTMKNTQLCHEICHMQLHANQK